jgi:hypothetical protein
MYTITRDQFAVAINNVYFTALNNPTEGLNAISLHNLVTHTRTTYTTILQPDVDDNMQEFIMEINPTLLLAVDTNKQEKCQDFAQYAKVSISEATMVITGTKAALSCRNMNLAWRE